MCVCVCSGMNDVRKESVLCDLYMVTKTVIEEACVRAERERESGRGVRSELWILNGLYNAVLIAVV